MVAHAINNLDYPDFYFLYFAMNCKATCGAIEVAATLIRANRRASIHFGFL